MRPGEIIEAVALGAAIAVVGGGGGMLLGFLLVSGAEEISRHHPADCHTASPPVEAAIAYDAVALRLYGDGARLNFRPTDTQSARTAV